MKAFPCPLCKHVHNTAIVTGNHIPEVAPAVCEECLKVFIMEYRDGEAYPRLASDDELIEIRASPIFKLVLGPLIHNLRVQRSAINN